MAAIIDCYEELIVERFGVPAARPFLALKELRIIRTVGSTLHW
jgi:hypothetical protein